MKTIYLATFLALAFSMATGQLAPTTEKAENPVKHTKPVATEISTEATITYLWDLVDTLELQVQVDKDNEKLSVANQKLQGAVNTLQNTCSKEETLTLGKDRKLICEAKAPEKKTPEVKK